jgi:hypothetical protein
MNFKEYIETKHNTTNAGSDGTTASQSAPSMSAETNESWQSGGSNQYSNSNINS